MTFFKDLRRASGMGTPSGYSTFVIDNHGETLDQFVSITMCTEKREYGAAHLPMSGAQIVTESSQKTITPLVAKSVFGTSPNMLYTIAAASKDWLAPKEHTGAVTVFRVFNQLGVALPVPVYTQTFYGGILKKWEIAGFDRSSGKLPFLTTTWEPRRIEDKALDKQKDNGASVGINTAAATVSQNRIIADAVDFYKNIKPDGFFVDISSSGDLDKAHVYNHGDITKISPISLEVNSTFDLPEREHVFHGKPNIPDVTFTINAQSATHNWFRAHMQKGHRFTATVSFVTKGNVAKPIMPLNLFDMVCKEIKHPDMDASNNEIGTVEVVCSVGNIDLNADNSIGRMKSTLNKLGR